MKEPARQREGAAASKGRKLQRPSGRSSAADRESPESSPGDSFLTRHGWRLLALLALVTIAYFRSFDSGLVFDNSVVIGADTRIRAVTADHIREILTGGYWQTIPSTGLYRPITTLTYLLNYAVLGNEASPAGYHVINLALHWVNAALVYALGLLVWQESAAAIMLAGLWAVHPVLTESVTNIVGRADLLAALGVLAGFLAYARSLNAPGRARWYWITAAAGAQTVGLFSKESAAVLPGLMLLYDLTWTERASWRRRWPAYAALMVPLAAYFAMRASISTHMQIGFNENPMVTADFWTARLTAVKVLGKLAWLFLWPAHLSADYSYNAVPLFGWQLGRWQDVQALIALAALVGALALAWTARRKSRPLFFFLLFFLITAAPTSNLLILIGSVMAERFLYLPAVGLAGCAAMAIRTLAGRFSPQRTGVRAEWLAAALCLILAARTYARNHDWHDDLSLWSSAVQVVPESTIAHLNLGHALVRIPGKTADAIAQYQAALKIQPNYPQVHYDMGVALASIPGRDSEAIEEYREAIREKPDYAEPHYNMGVTLAGLSGREQDAIAEFREAIRIRPAYADAHYNLGTTLSRVPGQMDSAAAEWQATLRIEPGHAGAHNNLGNYWAKAGKMPEAIAEWTAAVRADPTLAQARFNLANAMAAQGHLREAVEQYQAAVAGDPRFAEAHNNLANVLAQIPGRLPDAIKEWSAAVALQPNLVEAHYNLGNALSGMRGHKAEALAEYEAAFRLRPSAELRQTIERLRASQ